MLSYMETREDVKENFHGFLEKKVIYTKNTKNILTNIYLSSIFWGFRSIFVHIYLVLDLD